MPRRRKNGPRRKRVSRQVDSLHYPLLYSFYAGATVVTYTKALYETFDRHRAFRISAISGEFSATKFPVLVTMQLFAPVSAADNTWSSRVILVPTGVVRRFRFRIPATANLWYPSNTSDTTVLFQIAGECVNKSQIGQVIGSVYLTIQLRPLEFDATCPKVMTLLPNIGCSSVTSESIEVLSSSDEEYFST